MNYGAILIDCLRSQLPSAAAAAAPGVGGAAGGLIGVSFDIEPRVTSPDSYQLYADLLGKVREKLDAANAQRAARVGVGVAARKLTLSIAGSWGYELNNVTCGALVGPQAILQLAL